MGSDTLIGKLSLQKLSRPHIPTIFILLLRRWLRGASNWAEPIPLSNRMFILSILSDVRLAFYLKRPRKYLSARRV